MISAESAQNSKVSLFILDNSISYAVPKLLSLEVQLGLPLKLIQYYNRRKPECQEKISDAW